ncbi:MAG: methyl-accepting chemotaxis protein [Cypionkella sp.]
MNMLNSIKVRYKLPLVMVGLSFLTALVLEFDTSYHFRQQSLEIAKERLADGVVSVKNELSLRVSARTKALQGLASSETVVEAAKSLASNLRGGAVTHDSLFSQYVTSNPNPAGKHDLLDRASGPETYNAAHAKYHAAFAQFIKLNDLYDLFIFDNNLRNAYTVEKETDFLADFASGPLAASPLGTILALAKAAPPGEVFTSTFASYAPSNGDPAAFMATRIVDGRGNPVGFLAVQLPEAEFVAQLAEKTWMGGSGIVFLVDDTTHAQSTSRFPEQLKLFDQLAASPQIEAALSGETKVFEDAILVGGAEGIAAVSSLEVPGSKWGIVAERERSDVMATAGQMMRRVMWVAGIVMLTALGLGILVSRSLTLPIDRMQESLDAMAQGDLAVKVSDTDRGDEIGSMAQSLDALLEKLSLADIAQAERGEMEQQIRRVLDMLSTGLQDLAANDLSQTLDQAFPVQFERLRQDFNGTLTKLTSTIEQVVEASQSIRNRTTEIASASEDLSRRTENQAAALEQTAAALDELTVSVKAAAEGSLEVETITRKARSEAEESGLVVKNAVVAMSKIEKSSEQISQIIGAIDDIAFQTNLLALNAGVEAARAGDAGKGFAVVASEVRALAQRSSAAAKEIKTLIVTSSQHVREGVDHVGKAGSALTNIVESVGHISSLVSNIAQGASEQSNGLAEINIGVTQLDQVTQQNAAMVEQTTAASHALHQDATGLAALVSVFVLPGGGTRDFAAAVAMPMTRNADFDLGGEDAQGAVQDAQRPSEDETPDWDAVPIAKVADARGQSIWQDF